jgi:hypothetical protein
MEPPPPQVDRTTKPLSSTETARSFDNKNNQVLQQQQAKDLSVFFASTFDPSLENGPPPPVPPRTQKTTAVFIQSDLPPPLPPRPRTTFDPPPALPPRKSTAPGEGFSQQTPFSSGTSLSGNRPIILASGKPLISSQSKKPTTATTTHSQSQTSSPTVFLASPEPIASQPPLPQRPMPWPGATMSTSPEPTVPPPQLPPRFVSSPRQSSASLSPRTSDNQTPLDSNAPPPLPPKVFSTNLVSTPTLTSSTTSQSSPTTAATLKVDNVYTNTSVTPPSSSTPSASSAGTNSQNSVQQHKLILQQQAQLHHEAPARMSQSSSLTVSEGSRQRASSVGGPPPATTSSDRDQSLEFPLALAKTPTQPISAKSSQPSQQPPPLPPRQCFNPPSHIASSEKNQPKIEQQEAAIQKLEQKRRDDEIRLQQLTQRTEELTLRASQSQLEWERTKQRLETDNKLRERLANVDNTLTDEELKRKNAEYEQLRLLEEQRRKIEEEKQQLLREQQQLMAEMERLTKEQKELNKQLRDASLTEFKLKIVQQQQENVIFGQQQMMYGKRKPRVIAATDSAPQTSLPMRNAEVRIDVDPANDFYRPPPQTPPVQSAYLNAGGNATGPTSLDPRSNVTESLNTTTSKASADDHTATRSLIHSPSAFAPTSSTNTTTTTSATANTTAITAVSTPTSLMPSATTTSTTSSTSTLSTSVAPSLPVAPAASPNPIKQARDRLLFFVGNSFLAQILYYLSPEEEKQWKVMISQQGLTLSKRKIPSIAKGLNAWKAETTIGTPLSRVLLFISDLHWRPNWNYNLLSGSSFP